ncbi:MAG: preprotein translocase subunit SecG [Fimbriimonadia bacterium]|nr:preprotein translocase subunit SecG [Fimbriimonadia bacterium]
MATLKLILTIVDVLVMVSFILLVAAQATRSEGIFSGGGASSGYVKSKPGFDDNVSKITLYLAIAFFTLTAVITYMP